MLGRTYCSFSSVRIKVVESAIHIEKSIILTTLLPVQQACKSGDKLRFLGFTNKPTKMKRIALLGMALLCSCFLMAQTNPEGEMDASGNPVKAGEMKKVDAMDEAKEKVMEKKEMTEDEIQEMELKQQLERGTADEEARASAEKAKGHSEEMANMSQDDMMKLWMEMNAPGEEHEKLSENVGFYKYVSTFWMSPDAPPTQTEGTTKVKAIMDGRYFIEKHKGDMMGMPFHGMSLYGYDKIKKEYSSIWIDNMGTGIMYFSGTMNADGNMVSKAKAINPMTGMEETHKVVHKDTENGWEMDYYIMNEQMGDGFKSMHIVYERAEEPEE